MGLQEYIDRFYGSNIEFATAIGVSRQQVWNWINAGFVVIDGGLYSKRRDLPPPVEDRG